MWVWTKSQCSRWCQSPGSCRPVSNTLAGACRQRSFHSAPLNKEVTVSPSAVRSDRSLLKQLTLSCVKVNLKSSFGSFFVKLFGALWGVSHLFLTSFVFLQVDPSAQLDTFPSFSMDSVQVSVKLGRSLFVLGWKSSHTRSLGDRHILLGRITRDKLFFLLMHKANSSDCHLWPLMEPGGSLPDSFHLPPGSSTDCMILYERSSSTLQHWHQTLRLCERL